MKIFNGLKYTDNFASCLGFVDKELEEISFHKNTKTVAHDAFKNCKKIKKVIFPKKFNTIGKSAFKNCTSLEEVVMPKEIRKISFKAFANTAIKNFSTPQKIIYCHEEAFIGTIFDNFEINSLYLIELLENIYITSKNYKINLKSNAKIVDGSIFIGHSLFKCAYNILPNYKIKLLKKNCFYGLTIDNLIIDDTIKIETPCFRNTSIKNLTLNGIKLENNFFIDSNIENLTFNNCDISEINCFVNTKINNMKVNYDDTKGFKARLNNNILSHGDCILYVLPEESDTFIIPKFKISIMPYAFCNTNYKTIIGPQHRIELFDNCFANQKYLENLLFIDNVKFLGIPFNNCQSLKEVTFGGIENIEKYSLNYSFINKINIDEKTKKNFKEIFDNLDRNIEINVLDTPKDYESALQYGWINFKTFNKIKKQMKGKDYETRN